MVGIYGIARFAKDEDADLLADRTAAVLAHMKLPQLGGVASSAAVENLAKKRHPKAAGLIKRELELTSDNYYRKVLLAMLGRLGTPDALRVYDEYRRMHGGRLVAVTDDEKIMEEARFIEFHADYQGGRAEPAFVDNAPKTGDRLKLVNYCDGVLKRQYKEFHLFSRPWNHRKSARGWG